MNDNFNLDELKESLRNYEETPKATFTLDDILRDIQKSDDVKNEQSAETETVPQTDEAVTQVVSDEDTSASDPAVTSIEDEVVKPEGVSITDAFEAIKNDKSVHVSDSEPTADYQKTDTPTVDDYEEEEKKQESVEITSEIQHERFFNTETFNTIKQSKESGVKSSLASFAKGEEEQDDGEEEYFYTSELTEEIDDFESPEEKEDILLELKKMNSSASFKSSVTFLLTVVSAIVFLCSSFGLNVPGINLTEGSKFFVIISLAISVLATVINFNSIIKGAASVIKFSCTQETMLLLAFLSNLALDLSYIINDVTFGGRYISFDFIYMLLLLFNIFAKKIMAKNILKNFHIASSGGQKTVVNRPEMEEIANDIILETGNGGDILYATKSKFVSDFIRNSFKDFELCSKKSRLSLILSIAVIGFSVFIYITSKSGAHALAYLAGAFTVITPVLHTFSFAVPIFVNSRKARKFGGAIVGSETAYLLKDSQTMIVDDSDVFNVTLNGIRLYGDSSVDEAIEYLCSLYGTVGGPLKPLFMDMLGDNVVSLPRADEIYYHENKGYSCLIHSKVFVVGSKSLIDHFGIEVDDSEFEIIYRQKQKNVLFVAYDGKLMGVFLLSYAFAHGVSKAFSIFENDQINVAIAERDANVSMSLINSCHKFEDDNTVRIMNFRTARNCFSKFEIKNKTASLLLSNTGLKGIAAAFHGCKAMLFAIKANNVIRIISSLMAMFLITFLLLFSEPSFTLPTHILIFQLLWSVPVLFVSLFSK